MKITFGNKDSFQDILSTFSRGRVFRDAVLFVSLRYINFLKNQIFLWFALSYNNYSGIFVMIIVEAQQNSLGISGSGTPILYRQNQKILDPAAHGMGAPQATVPGI